MWSWGRLRAAAHIVEQDGHQIDASGWARRRRGGARRGGGLPGRDALIRFLVAPYSRDLGRRRGVGGGGRGFVEKIEGARDCGALLRGGGGDVNKFND